MPAPPSRPVAAALSGLALAGLASCQKPTPYVTLVAGGDVVKSEASVYCRNGKSVDDQSCVRAQRAVPVIKVRPGDQLGVDVDKMLADRGWYLVANNERSPLQDQHYFAFTPTNFGDVNSIDLQVRSVDRLADDAKNTGVWYFRVVPR